MTSIDVRSNSAVMKRAEQLRRWEESDTNREPPTPRPEKGRKIKFSSGCVFLAACLAGDKEEVLKLIEQGADINTANVDGLTALHQACIDDNLEMVEFLVENGADINRQDNEGWTPLHATASCGFVSIARYLVEQGADVAAVNSDGDLAYDLAADIQHVPMIDFMQKTVEEHKIDCETARQAEEQLMLADAKRWLRSDASEVDRPHPKTGATALHVASAKGYTKVLSLLLAGRANVDKQDNDGWTPLHAAAHWGQKEAAEMLVDAMADMEVRNYAGQSCIDVSDRKTVKFLEELRANNKRTKRRPSSQIRISDTIENHIENTPTKIIRVEVKPDQTKELPNDDRPRTAADVNKLQQTATSDTNTEDEAPWRRNSVARARNTNNEIPTKNQVPEKEASKTNATESSDVILRRTQSFENDEKFYQKYNELRARIKANSCPTLPATQNSSNNNNNNNSNNNNSNNSNSNRNNSHNNCIINNIPSVTNNTNSTIQNYTVQRSASLKDHRNFRKPLTPPITPAVTPATASTAPSTTATTTITTPRRSFVPPTRDEESETQRKLHAKRVRETRRSTQGVTLEEIKSAEELVKKKNSAMNNNNNNNNNNSSSNFKLEDASSLGTTNFPPNNSTIIPSAPAVIAAANLSATSAQRRNPSVTSSNQSLNSIGRPISAPAAGDVNFSNKNLADKSSVERIGDAVSSYTVRRLNSASTPSVNSVTAASATIGTNNSYTNATATATAAATAASKNNEEKDNDKENDNRSTVATNAVIQRRRKPKRRSTGVVHLDMDDSNPERADAANDTDEKEKEKEREKERAESGSERNSRSRLGSNASNSATDDRKSRDKSEGGETIDYKALWEAAKLENDKLKQQLKKKDEETVQTRATLERFTNATTKNSLSDIEKRERRAMERKVSEMEEELKLLQKLKTENERLRAENRALTRVVSKLTTSAQSQLAKK